MNIITFFSLQIKKSPLRTIVLGILLIIITAVCLVFIGNILDKVPVIAAFDKIIYEKINLGAKPAWLETLVAPFNYNFISWGGGVPSFLYIVFALGVIYIVIFNRKDILYAILAFIIAMVIDALLFKIINTYVLRDRPFIHLLNSVSDSAKSIWTHWSTFPSGHVRDMALYSTILAGYASKLKWPFIVITLWVGYGRIFVGAHYPTDILAGMALGYLVGLGILMIVKSLQQIIKNRKNPPISQST